jgi:hypothetical protein
METGGSLPHSQQPATCPYPEQLEIHHRQKYSICETQSYMLNYKHFIRVKLWVQKRQL